MFKLAALALLALPALAHRPTFGEGYSSPESAYEVQDPDVSIVVYQEITCEAPQVWLSFEAQSDYELFVQLGVPEIDRLSDYRPSIAVLAPGLPTVELPFDIPEGLGAVVFDTEDVSEPDGFYEPFTQTASWVLTEQTVVLPEAGAGYVVAWDPSGSTGKLWVAVGTIEDFGNVDWSEAESWGEDVNGFHETGRYQDPPDIEEQVCDEADHDDDHGAEGCSTLSTPPSGAWALAMGAMILGVRRRSASA